MPDRPTKPTKRDWPVAIFWLALPIGSLAIYSVSQSLVAGLAVFVLGFVAFAIWAKRTGRLDRIE
ncbi:MAG: hypothetical protein EXR60_05905 [Dehalococcoidia bacterium]|nr:hypothetical protein [Dehalococcoidia bacterium]